MPTKWYSKELPTSPIWIMGYPMRFDLLETSDGALISELDNAIRNRMGGVSSITQETYLEESKKKQDENPFGSSSNPQPWRQELTAPLFQPNAAGGQAGSFAKPQQPQVVHQPVQPHERPDPLTVPSPESLKIPRPPTAKLNKPAP